MRLEELLRQKKSTILDRWFDVIVETYPAETRRFLKELKNRFANPVAHEISRGIEGIFEQLLKGGELEDASSFLDKVIRIRAVQEFAPSSAVAFVLDLKRVIRKEMASESQSALIPDELAEFESRIDRLALLAFDMYVRCREQIYELRVKEVKKRVGRLLERANLICNVSEPENSLEDINNRSLT